MIALFKKELRALVPLFFLGAFLVSGDFISRPFSERLDEATYSSVASIDPGEGTFIGFIQLVLGFVVAYAAFGREHDEKTIEFLYALPVSRFQIFMAKVLAGLVVLTGIAVLGQITNWILVAPNPESFASAQVQVDLLARVALLHVIAAAVGYGHGLFASVFRRFGVLPYVFVGFALTVLVEIYPPVDFLDPLRLARTEYDGSTLLIPWTMALGHLVVAACAAALSYPLWMGSFERTRGAMVQRSLVSTLLFGGGVVTAVITGLGVSIFFALREYGSEPPPDPDAPVAPTEITFLTAEAHTTHYTFVYPENLRGAAMALVTRGDRVLEAAASTTGATDLPFITVDLAETSSHHEGIAAGSRIRMGLVDQAPWRLAHVLAHESTHVLQHTLSDMHLGEHGETTRFFIEGSAEWVAFEVCENEALDLTSAEERVEEGELRAASRLVAALSAERHAIRFETLLDDGLFRSRYDTALAYPLGETLTEAIARGCGDDAPGRFMRSFARPERPQDARGEVLFRDALQSFGCDLERVIGAWDGLLEETRVRERARIDAVPQMRLSSVTREGDSVVLGVDLDRPPLPYERYFARIRRNEAATDVEVIPVGGERTEGTQRVVFRVPISMLPDVRFEVLFSLEVDPRAFPYSERWQSVAMP